MKVKVVTPLLLLLFLKVGLADDTNWLKGFKEIEDTDVGSGIYDDNGAGYRELEEGGDGDEEEEDHSEEQEYEQLEDEEEDEHEKGEEVKDTEEIKADARLEDGEEHEDSDENEEKEREGEQEGGDDEADEEGKGEEVGKDKDEEDNLEDIIQSSLGKEMYNSQKELREAERREEMAKMFIGKVKQTSPDEGRNQPLAFVEKIRRLALT